MANSGVSSEVMKHKFNWKSERMTHEYISISKNALVVSANAITGGHAGSQGGSQPSRDSSVPVPQVVPQPTSQRNAPVPQAVDHQSGQAVCHQSGQVVELVPQVVPQHGQDPSVSLSLKFVHLNAIN